MCRYYSYYADQLINHPFYHFGLHLPIQGRNSETNRPVKSSSQLAIVSSLTLTNWNTRIFCFTLIIQKLDEKESSAREQNKGDVFLISPKTVGRYLDLYRLFICDTESVPEYRNPEPDPPSPRGGKLAQFTNLRLPQARSALLPAVASARLSGIPAICRDRGIVLI